MANVRIAKVTQIGVDAAGNVVPKNTSTIKQVITSSSEHRVIGTNSTVAPSAYSGGELSYPTIEEYLTAEYAAGFKLVYMDQYNIVTDDDLNA